MLAECQKIGFLIIYSIGNQSMGSGQEVDPGNISMMCTLKILRRD